jgi:O-antigen/teichoic acid export membrane protein
MSQSNRLRALKNVLGSWLGLGTSVIAGFALTPYVLHHVGDSAYGVWILLTAFTGYYGLLDLGLRSATVRYVARHVAVNETDELNRVVSTSFVFYTALGLTMMVVTGIVVLLFDRLFKVGPEWQATGRALLLVVGFGTALNMPFTLFSGVLEGLQRFSLVGWMQTVSVIIRAGLLIFFLERGYTILTVGVITMIMNILSALVLTLCAFRLAPSLRIRFRDASLATLKTLGGYGLVIFWISIAQSLRFQFDAVVIGWMISAEAITYFSFGSRLSVYSLDVVQMMAQIFTPMASAADATGEHDRQKRIFLMGNRYSAFVALPLGAMFLLAGGTIIRVWVGAKYEAVGYTVLAILTVPTTIYLMQAGSPKVLFGMAKHKTLAVVLMVEAIANLILSIALAPRFGLLGVAWGTAIPLAVTNIFFLPLHLCHLLDVRLRDFLWESYLYPVLAVIPAAATLWVADRRIHAVNWFGLIGTLALGGLAYAATLGLYLYFVEGRRVPAASRQEIAVE